MQRGAIFVTGANSGIGLAAARRLTSLGYDVIPGVRRPDAMPDVSGKPVTIDLADAASVDNACSEVLDRAAGRLVALVNNAGYSVSGPVETLTVADWRAQFEVNFFAQIAITRALLPQLLANHGRVVNVGSIGGRFATPFLAPYSASKFAVRAWTDAMRIELAPHGVRVALVEPGAIDTAIWGKGTAAAQADLAKLDPDQQRRYAKQIEGAFATAKFAADHAISPDKVADVIAHAITARRPKGRYLIGADARLQAGLSILPTRLLDGAARRLLRQPRRP